MLFRSLTEVSAGNLAVPVKGDYIGDFRFIPVSYTHLDVYKRQVITLCAATHKVMLSVEVSDIKEFQMNMLAWFDEKHPKIGKQIEETRVLNDDLTNRIVRKKPCLFPARCKQTSARDGLLQST